MRNVWTAPTPQVPSSVLCFSSWVLDLFIAGVRWGASGTVRSNSACVFLLCVCVCCVTERQRADAGQRGLSVYTWSHTGGWSWGLGPDAVPQSATSYVHTQTHAVTQTPFLSEQLRYGWEAQVPNVRALDGIDDPGNDPQFVQGWRVIDGGFVVGGICLPREGELI